MLYDAAQYFPEYWSCDLLTTKGGWYITDMAEGERSYRNDEECQIIISG